MFKIAQTILGAVALFVLIFGPYILLDKPFLIKYNCDMAEISPDFLANVKQQCRDAKAKP